MHGEIQPLLESFSNQQGMVKEELRRRFTRDPDKFARDAITVLKSGEDAPGTRFLAHLVLGNETLVRTIADPAECALEDAVAVARTIARADARLELELDRLLERSLKTKDPASNAVVLRVLDILDAVSSGNRAAQYQAELMNHAYAPVRSKAALTIARGSRSLGWVAAQLREGEPRVQANAIEALWGMDNANCRSVFNMAVAAPNSRVVGNALIGLYLMSDVSSIAGILNLAMEADPRRRGTGIWAMGQTQDPRFLPYLNAAFEAAEEKDRHAIVRALVRIRRRQKQAEAAGPLGITVVRAAAATPLARSVGLALSSPNCESLPPLIATQFAIFEGGSLVTDYEVSFVPTPPVMIFGFMLPRYTGGASQYGAATAGALQACLKRKRESDYWAVERYAVAQQGGGGEALPASEPEALHHMRRRFGFVKENEILQKFVTSVGPLASEDIPACLSKLTDAASHIAGSRRLFLFVDPEWKGGDPPRLAVLSRAAARENVVIHGWALGDEGEYTAYRDLCVATRGSFEVCALEQLVGSMERTYASLFNRYEMSYKIAAGGAGDARVLVTCAHGYGEAEFTVAVPAADAA